MKQYPVALLLLVPLAGCAPDAATTPGEPCPDQAATRVVVEMYSGRQDPAAELAKGAAESIGCKLASLTFAKSDTVATAEPSGLGVRALRVERLATPAGIATPLFLLPGGRLVAVVDGKSFEARDSGNVIAKDVIEAIADTLKQDAADAIRKEFA